jgi:hypothetical protein
MRTRVERACVIVLTLLGLSMSVARNNGRRSDTVRFAVETAKALSLELPGSLLARADEVMTEAGNVALWPLTSICVVR